MNGKSLDEVILSCDKDGNGIIDYNEFKAAMLLEWQMWLKHHSWFMYCLWTYQIL